jgi:hypothetical protein
MQLPLEVQYHCQSTLLGLTRDDVTSVRAAASRAVGVLVLYKVSATLACGCPLPGVVCRAY